MGFAPGLAQEDYCYLTTTGRVSGQPREIEIWFALAGGSLYMLSGGRDRADWVRNLRKEPSVSVRIGRERLTGRAHVVTEPAEDTLARRLLFEKYSSLYGGDLDSWRETALPIAVDLVPRTAPSARGRSRRTGETRPRRECEPGGGRA